jgi:hypothetical protein
MWEENFHKHWCYEVGLSFFPILITHSKLLYFIMPIRPSQLFPKAHRALQGGILPSMWRRPKNNKKINYLDL